MRKAANWPCSTAEGALISPAVSTRPRTESTPLKIRAPFLNSLAAGLFAGGMWLLFRTLRIRLITGTPSTSPYDRTCSERYLYSVWHDSMVLPVFAGKHWCTTALTSQHSDGSFVAEVLKHRGIPAVRGSTSRIRTGAIRELMEHTASRHLVITPDGPRGPSRQMSIGIAYLSSRTGRAVVPSGFACSRYYRWKGSWSDLIIPKPFSRLILVAGPPIYVPEDLTIQEIKPYLEEIQLTMDRLEQQAEGELNRHHSTHRSPQARGSSSAVASRSAATNSGHS